MFDRHVSADQFLQALRQLESATSSSKPAALHNAVKRVLERTEGFEGSKLAELIAFIAEPPKKPTAKRKKSASATSLRAASPELTREIATELDKVVEDEVAFNELVKHYANTCNATAIKEAAAAFAASALPTTKPNAVKLFKGERANRIRTSKKIEQSGKATPW